MQSNLVSVTVYNEKENYCYKLNTVLIGQWQKLYQFHRIYKFKHHAIVYSLTLVYFYEILLKCQS